MASPFLAEIKIFSGNFAPRGHAFCNGQILSISQNTALFAIIGTFYGGNGTTTFALPDLRGRAPVNFGAAPGLTPYAVGELTGSPTQTLNTNQLPQHTHTPNCFATSPNSTPLATPAGNVWAVAGSRRAPINLYKADPPGTTTTMNASALSLAGGTQPHNNMQPFLALSFIIALQGIFPSRN